MIPWIKKYEPKNSNEIPQPGAIKQIRDYVTNYKRQNKKALLAHGSTGTCKTVAVYSIAKEQNCEVVELNASEFRKADQINQKVGNALKQQSLFYASKLILIDEVDCLSGLRDRGGLAALSKLLENSRYPIIMTANDAYDKKLNSIRKKSMLVEFKTLNYISIFNILKKICDLEKVLYEESALKTLARAVGGDLRAAINDLQTLSRGNKKLTSEIMHSIDERQKIESIPNALIKVFKNSDPKIALRAFDNVSENLDKCLLWIDENLPKEYTKGADLKRAYESISRADLFKGRIRKWQYWRYLVYVNMHLTAGIASAKDEKYKTFQRYIPTTRILKIWIANMKYKKRKAIAEKMSEKLHCSSRRAIQDILPFVKTMFRNLEKAKELTKFFDLDKDEVAWMRK